MNTEKLRIGICTTPLESASVSPTSNLIDILKSLSRDLILITGSEGYSVFEHDPRIKCYGSNRKTHANFFIRVKDAISFQLLECYIILMNKNKIDLWVFFMGGERQLFPILISKLMRKPCLLIQGGSLIKSAIYGKDPFLVAIKLLCRINCFLIDGIIIYSPRLLEEAKLEKYKKKVFIAQRHFIDIDLFKSNVKYDKRPNMIGYLGRLSNEKGVVNLVQSFLGISSKNPNILFFIGGEGALRKQLIDIVSDNGLENKVTFSGWIPHDKLPFYLNQLKLLVLPSYTEGLPNIMLEAMACGTPVLATPVGAIPDIIINKKTGFILPDNSPDSIEESIIKVLNHPNLDTVVTEGKSLIENKFSFEKAVESYATILSKFIQSNKVNEN
jgi:glycosyltransferase involved in cell wall biosynthesis